MSSGYGSPERPSNRRALPDFLTRCWPSRFGRVDSSKPAISSFDAPSKTGVASNDEGDIEIIKESRGVKTSYMFKKSYVDLPESVAIAQLREQIIDDFEGKIEFIRGEEKRITSKPLELINMVLESGKKGVSIQRFKGLGEMNAEQLWETTLDPSNRTLLQVRVEQFDEADQTFSTLMGNVVEPRRDFIQENALKVVNLDV